MSDSPRRVGRRVLSLTLALLVAAAVAVAPAAASTPTPAAPTMTPARTSTVPAPAVDDDVCAPTGPVAPGLARCFALEHRHLVRDTTTGAVTPAAASSGPIGGITPSQLRAAYGVSTATAPAGTTVAIVDAYDAPSVESDLAAFRTQYGLPACTSANGCFRKVDQRGAVVAADKSRSSTVPPVYQSSWQLETTLDTQAVSAICPTCRILLVEADSTSLTSSLGPALAMAVSLGAKIVSNSFGSGESAEQLTADTQFWNQPGVSIFAATGDSGWDNFDLPPGNPSYAFADYPATSPYVTAVGGTSLVLSGGAVTTESVWSAGGSGCSVLEGRPAGQSAYFAAKGIDPDPGSPTSHCVRLAAYGGGDARAEADIAMLADPGAPGFPVVLQGVWKQAGGTSLSAPLAAGLQGLAGPRGTGTSWNDVAYGLAARGASGLHDVTAGTNRPAAFGCGGNRICTATTGWDGPTGLGAPRGLGLFTPLLRVSPTTTVPGATVTVTGSNFAPGEAVSLTSGPTALAPVVTAGSLGTFSVDLTLPVPATAPLPVTATGATSGFTATQYVAFTPAAVGPSGATAIVPLTSLPVSVSGFAANESVTVAANGGSFSALRTGNDGSGTTTVLVPAGVGATVTLTATGTTSGITARSAALPVIAPGLAPRNPVAHVGDTVTLAATGFGSRENVATDVGSAPASAGADGTFDVTWTVPAGTSGTTPITASGTQTGVTAVAYVDVLTTGLPPLAPKLLSAVPLTTGTAARIGVRLAATGAAATSVRVFASDGTASPAAPVSAVGDAFATVTGLTPGRTYTFCAVSSNAAGDSFLSAASLPITTGDDLGTGDLTPVGPIRIYDSRTDPRGALRSGEIRTLPVGGTAGVPATGVSAVVVSLTVVAPTNSGFVTLYPAGPTRPATSTANFVAGQFKSSLAKIALGNGGALAMYNLTGRTDVVLDVVGFYADDSGTFAHNQSYAPVTPVRVMDTRSFSAPTFGAQTSRTVVVRGGATGVPASATTVELGVQAVNAQAQGFLTVYPTGLAGGTPTVSNVQYAVDRPVVTAVVATIGSNGTVTVYAHMATDVIIDLLGYYSGDPAAASERFVPITPTRFLDTRVAGGPVGQQQTRTLAIAGAAAQNGTRPVPPAATEAEFSLVGVDNTAPTFVTAWQAGATRPMVTSLLPQPAQLLFDNLVLGQLGAGRISLFNNLGALDLVVDVEGYFLDVGSLSGS